MLLSKEIPVMIRLATGEFIMGKVLEMKVVKEVTPFGRATLVLEDVATFQTGRHPQKPQEVIYNLLQWQTEDVYIPWDKILTFSVANSTAQEYYRQVFQRVQVADINEVKAMERGDPKRGVVINTP